MKIEDAVWIQEEQALWSRIAAHPFENPSIALDFTRRFARQLGWSIETARQAITEYRRFCFLAMVTRNGPVTPSEEVDEVWHLHLTFTRDYWDRWCGAALGRPLHHDPTEGGPVEAARYHQQYAETLALYERYFGPPPEVFWPGIAQRFGAAPRYRQVDAARVFVLPRPRLPRAPLFAGILAVPSSATASAQEVGPETTWNMLDWSGDPFLTLYVPMFIVSIAVAYVLNATTRIAGRPPDERGLAPIAIAYLVGGRDRAADTLLLEAAVAGRAEIEQRHISLKASSRDMQDRLQPFGSLPPGRYRRADLLRSFAGSARAQAIRDDLQRRNLFLSPARAFAARAVGVATMIPVFVLGLAKLFVGLSRDKPVGFLVLLLAIGLFAILGLLTYGRLRTREGETIASGMRSDRPRPVRAPLPAELPLAFAVLGAPALAGSAFSPLAAQIAPGGGDGGSGGCSGGGSSGCGGGGCGGCSS